MKHCHCHYSIMCHQHAMLLFQTRCSNKTMKMIFKCSLGFSYPVSAFDTVGTATGMASGLQKSTATVLNGSALVT